MALFPELVAHFAEAISAVDARAPVAINRRSKKAFQPGIGPHSEAEVVQLVGQELGTRYAALYGGRWHTAIPYPQARRQRCDLCIGTPGGWEWAIEVKLLRFLGDNGKVNDNILMHILSPYPQDRSALTDCDKLLASGLAPNEGIIIFGYDHDDWPLDPAVEAFEALAHRRVGLGDRVEASFDGLIHPVHRRGRVFGWVLETR